ncbi:bifunctional metallophosphatase/5'-nucleotidase [Geminicoccus roseus]|uniref:bifunctional metallophosphatase/5'-nucleotidase n=1 Tax=Geminicoccus roseus TaxID=404900 RepID=UPI0012FA2E52
MSPLLVPLPAMAADPAEPVAAADPAGPLNVTLLAINDFHGNLLPPDGGIKVPDPADPSQTIRVPAGGAEAMATLIRQRRAEAGPNSVFVAAGDLIGASPLLSGILHDEPTIEALSLMGLEASAVGNHEFDDGLAELLRMQNGGCHPNDDCGDRRFGGASFQYLAASTIDDATGQPVLSPYVIKEFEGIPVAFIGLTLKGTPGIVVPSGVEGLTFKDEAETVNALVPELQGQGTQAIVVLLHEGGYPTGGINDCPGISGAITEIVPKLDRAVDVVVSGHTHKAYVCEIDNRLVTSGDKFGTLVTEIGLEIDRASGDVVSAQAQNLIVRTEELARDPGQTALIQRYQEIVAPLAERVVGRIAQSLTKEESHAGETTLGDVVADAQLAATRAEIASGAEIAFTNPGGVRTDLPRNEDGQVTYAELFAVQPFGNSLVTMSLTGAQIERMLEQQWLDQPKPRILHVSDGFTYRWDGSRPVGERVDPDTMKLHGTPVDPQSSYRVTVNNFLADGGDGFTVLREGTDRVTGPYDVDALAAYVEAAGELQAPPLDRIGRVD